MRKGESIVASLAAIHTNSARRHHPGKSRYKASMPAMVAIKTITGSVGNGIMVKVVMLGVFCRGGLVSGLLHAS